MRRRPQSKTAYTVCIAAAILFFTLFTVRLIDWQLVHGEDYRALSSRSTNYTVKTDAVRGEILDVNGEGLVVNTTHYRVVIDKLYADENKLDETILGLIALIERAGDEWDNVLPIEITEAGFTFVRDADEEKEILLSEDFLNMSEDAFAEECVGELAKRYEIGEDYSREDQLRLLSVYYNMERTGYSGSKPYVFASDISRDTVSVISENTQGMSGIDVQTYLVRGAASPTLAPHLLGALGAISEEEYNELTAEGKDYLPTDQIGKFGIELAFESELRGTEGAKVIKRNSDGSIVDTVETINAKPGNTVYLTLDSKIQQAAVKSLEKNVKAAKQAGIEEKRQKGKGGVGEDCETGAAVMMSIKDFSVLASASYPTYDLNRYSEYGSYYISLAENKNSPMYNRAFSGSFACGSVFKPCVAAAALEEGIIDTQTEIHCGGVYDYYPKNVVRCMHVHGDMTLFGALTESCNYFFAETGRRLGIETMYLYAERFGLGEYTGVEVEESKGILAGRDSTQWQGGNTVQAAIGQSDNAFTPLQLCTYAATIANNGTRLKAHTVSKITDYEREKTIADYSKAETADTCGVSDENLRTVREAMLSVTQSTYGTAYSVFGNYKVKVAAKTGTAENSGSDHTTFICYAPYDNPEVAVAVVLEHGAKGRYSMQVAKDMLDSYFDSKK